MAEERTRGGSVSPGTESGAPVPPGLLIDLLAAGGDTRALDRLAAALQTAGAAAAAILLDRATSPARIAGSAGLDALEDRAGHIALARMLDEWVGRTGEPAWSAEPHLDARFALDPAGEIGRVRAVPLAAGGTGLGSAVVFWPAGATTPLDRDVGAAGVLAEMAAAALVVSRLHDSLRDERTRRGDVERTALRTAREVSGASMAADIAREIEVAAAGIDPAGSPRADGPGRDAVERLRRLAGQMVDVTVGEETPPEAVQLDSVLDECLAAVGETVARREIRLRRRPGKGIPPVRVPVRELRRGLSRLFSLTAAAVPRGGRLDVRTVRRGDSVDLEVRADAPRDAGGTLERLWILFGDEGDGRGLSPGAVRSLLGTMGVTVTAASSPEWPSLYRISIPLEPNRERRGGLPDRRLRGRGERRAA